MYTKGMIERYAATIDNEHVRGIFLMMIDGIKYTREGVRETCDLVALKAVLAGTSVEEEGEIFERTWEVYARPEDFDQKPAAPTN